MADTKVSGLTAAASFLTTHELPVNEAGTSKKVTGAQILAKAATGRLGAGVASITANSATFTTVVDITGLAITVTPAASRCIRLSTWCGISSSVNTDTVTIQLFEGATQLAQGMVTMGTASGHSYVYVSCILFPTSAAHTYKVSALRSAGTGNCLVEASATQPSYILAEDIGV